MLYVYQTTTFLKVSCLKNYRHRFDSLHLINLNPYLVIFLIIFLFKLESIDI